MTSTRRAPVQHAAAQQTRHLPPSFILVLLWLALLSIPTVMAEQVYRVGITSFRDKPVTLNEWQPTMDFLSSQLPGSRFEAVPMTLSEFETALGQRELDFVLTNPQHYILMESLYGVSRIATLVKLENGKLVNQFGGVIFTRSDRSDIHRLEDIKGHSVAAVDRTSFAAFLLQYDILKQSGVDLDTDSQIRYFGFPQDRCVMAVLDGEADVGFVRTGVLEAMAREGKIDLARLRIVNPTSPADFPFLISTELYPEWPLAAAPHVPIDISNQVAAALLLMPPDSPAARSARYHRWSTPLEYQRVQTIMRRHRVYPFDKPDEITLSQLVHSYAAHIMAALLLTAVALTILYLRTRRLNVELKASRRKLSDMAHHDALTGLPNRNLLDDRLTQALAQARRRGHKIALCLADLDGFKPINDSLGHKAGDEVLQEVAHRLENSLRLGDTVARWGGDEFVLLVNGFADLPQLEDIMKRMLAAISGSAPRGSSLPLSASIGVSIFPTHADDSLGLIKHADEAMYHAKKSGGNRVVIYNSDIPPLHPARHRAVETPTA